MTPAQGKHVLDIERASPGDGFGARGIDPGLLARMRRYGYLDEGYRRTTGLARLKHLYRDEGLALFVGAGASRDSGIPDWRGLLNSMLPGMVAFASGAVPAGSDHKLSELLEADARLPMISQFDLIAHDCKDADRSGEFNERLRDHLYRRDPRFQRIRELANAIPEDNAAKPAHDWAPLLAELEKNATLAALGNLLILKTAGGFAVNPLIHGVLTTNVDNLLQLHAMSRSGGHRLLDTVNDPGADERQGRLPVYHLHGWLDMRDARAVAVSSPPLVFRESEYFHSIANPGAFANHTAQYFFQRRCVLFVGTSLEDLNIRRWLFNAFEERRTALERRLRDRYPDHAGAGEEAYAASIRHVWLKRETDFPEPRAAIKDFLEDTMRHLGVQVLWYREHPQAAEWIRGLAH